MIDFDNVTMGIRSDLQSELRRLLQSDIIRGKVAVQRAYADWRRYPQYIVPLSESSIDLIFAPAYGSNKKNATDIRLAIDALELVFTRPEIGTFILLSGDSDFSSLVLKLKEYGKYVIGVGIRESSSDLLIQNCDEYYSYNELAGLTRESDVTQEHRDPWELVVEAMKQMTAHNDVMRSDRLKQVMQEIAPAFDEKDAGFSRFSKFVVEAAHRGLLALTKLDNGQYELALGPEVTGAPAGPAAARAPREQERERHPSGGDGRGRRHQAGASAAPSQVSEFVAALRQALGRLGAPDQAVSADQVRDTMQEIAGSAEALDPELFLKLLRQAQDAEVIDLSKDEAGGYLVRLRPERTAEPSAPVEVQAEAAVGDGTAASAVAGIPARSARFRRGSRGARLTPPEVPNVGVVEVDPNFKPRVELVPSRPAGQPPPPAPVTPTGRGEDEGRGGRGGDRVAPTSRGEDEGRGGRGGDRPRRGRGRRGGAGRRGQSGTREGAEREGERGRRGGRGRSEPRLERDEERVEPVAARAPAAPVTPSPTPVAAPLPNAVAEPEGESFWTRVRRGLTGGG
ncbi:MAG TPA: NYN domain-containing protein [Gemmatimonadales bacterium]|nr:NYN domain-containing protein [Gemmatimonadales bacterium]